MVQISVIILVKNGGALLEEVLEGILTQKGVGEYEIVAVDSGSTDLSREILRRHPVRVEEISPSTFNHGETRNLGARLSQGSFLVYLTQDATPANDHWLATLVEPLREDPLVAGTFSSHRPRKGCPLMEKRQILQTALTSGSERRVNTAVGNPEYSRNPYPFIWFSNTSSCIRKAVWEEFPFRRIEFAEDQDWAKRVLDAGYKTVYVPGSTVIHSHHYRPVRNFRRYFEHARAMKEIFGKEEFPHFTGIFSATRQSVKDDFQFFRSEGGRSWVFLKWVLPSLSWYLAAFTGLWLGTHLERIPLRMREWFSLQPSIIKK